MSNPFATFRKNKNYWMAGLVLLAILAFVVAPAIDQASQAFRGGGAESAVVVRWNGGKLTVSDLRNNIQKHASLVRFLSAVAQEVIAAGGQPQVPGFYYDPQSKQILGLGIQANSDEGNISRTRILADYARKLGVEFDDQAIDDFIVAYCDRRVSTQRLSEILYETSDGRLSSFEVRELLKRELAAMVVQRTATTGFYLHSPGGTYQDFLKLNQSATVSAFPVFVDDYVSEVTGQPNDSEIQAIYDVGISLATNPNSPDPVLVRPYQADVEYIESNLQEWIDREKAKLTEEQLRAEYDRQLALGQLKIPVDSAEQSADGETGTSDSAAGGATEGESSSSTEPASDAAPVSEAAQPTGAGATEPAAGNTPLAPGESSQSPQPDSPPSAEGPDDSLSKPDDQAYKPKASQHLVAFVQDQDADDPLPPPVVQPPQLNADPQDAATGEPEQPAMRTQTFEEARENIADTLARNAAIPALDAELTNLFENVMKPYYGAYQQYVAFRDAEVQVVEDEVEEPPKPNLKKLAEDAGLKYGQTGLVDYAQLMQTQVGRGSVRQDESGITGRVADVVADPQLKLFRPLQSSYFDQEALQQGRMPEFFQYLLWKTEERPAYVPELDEVREEVVDIWKRQQARILAESAASALAKKVSPAADNPWENALSTAQQTLLVETDPFTWISRFNEYNMITPVPKLDEAGAEFMQDVFTTPAGQVTVAPNQNGTVVYVVYVQEFSPSAEELRQQFIDDPVKSGPAALSREQSDRLAQSWFEHLYNELGVEWQMSPDQF